MYKVMLIDDEESLHMAIEKLLTKNGYEYCGATDAESGMEMLAAEKPDLLLLDVMLPGMNGFDLCTRIRAEGRRIPIIFLSAKNDIVDKSIGFRAGGDDYVTKPFDPDEVAARIHAVLRRAAGASAAAGAGGVCPDDEALVHRDLRLDVARRRVTLGDAEVALTAHEFDILHVLMRSPDKVFSRELLYELVWKNGYYGEQNAVNVHVSNIRKKLAAAGGAGDYIKTVWGIGFKLA